MMAEAGGHVAAALPTGIPVQSQLWRQHIGREECGLSREAAADPALG